jgi:hypothetical protein
MHIKLNTNKYGIQIRDKRIVFFWVVTQHVVIVPYRRFEKPIVTILKEIGFLDHCSEISVRNYHYSLRNRSEEHRSHLFGGGSLKITLT